MTSVESWKIYHPPPLINSLKRNKEISNKLLSSGSQRLSQEDFNSLVEAEYVRVKHQLPCRSKDEELLSRFTKFPTFRLRTLLRQNQLKQINYFLHILPKMDKMQEIFLYLTRLYNIPPPPPSLFSHQLSGPLPTQ